MHRRSHALIVGVVALAMTGCQANRTDGSPSAKGAHKLGAPAAARAHNAAGSAAKTKIKAKAKVKAQTAAARHAGSAGSPAGTDVLTTRPSANLPNVGAGRPATPHGLPGTGQLHPQHLDSSVVTRIENQCPPVGAKNYEKACVNDTHNFLRWGNEQWGFNTHRRIIAVVDEFTPGSRASLWLQATVTTFNKLADSRNTPGGADRPHFIWMDLATAKTKTSGQIKGACSARLQNFVELCAYDQHNPAHRRSQGTHFELFQKGPHIVGGHGIIKFHAGETDQAIESAVVHEFGHAVGFAHDMDCSSVMSDCGTQQERDSHYMWFGPNQMAAYNFLYVTHPHN